VKHASAPALTERERDCLHWMLPGQSGRYAAYRETMESCISAGRIFGDNDLLLFGATDDADEIAIVQAPVFAHAVFHFPRHRVTMTVHDSTDGIIPLRITPRLSDSAEHEIGRWSLSYWRRGESAGMREIVLPGARYTLALAPMERRLWLHDNDDYYNRLLPATAIYNHLMRHLRIRNSELVLAPQRLFSHHDEFSDIDLMHALQAYAGQTDRIDLPYFAVPVPERRFSISRIMEKFRNNV
jgi:hypothetical protein